LGEAAPILRTSHVSLFVGCACLLVGDGVMSNHAAMAEADRRCTHSRPDKRRLSVSSISTHKRQRQRQRQREPRRLSGRPVRRLCSSIRQCMDRPVMPGPRTDDPRLGWTSLGCHLHCYPLPTEGGAWGLVGPRLHAPAITDRIMPFPAGQTGCHFPSLPGWLWARQRGSVCRHAVACRVRIGPCLLSTVAHASDPSRDLAGLGR